jgi:hypothetical protein
LAPRPAEARGGLLFGLDFGGGLGIGGEEGSIADSHYCEADHSYYGRADVAHGIAATLRLGYNVMGFASIEAALFAHGGSGEHGWEGLGHVGGLVKFYPIQFLTLSPKLKPKVKNRRLDGALYFGAGYSMGGYHITPDPLDGDARGRGWSGAHVQWGATFEFRAAKPITVGLDLKFLRTIWTSYITDWDPRENCDVEEASTTVFAPMAILTFHLWDPHEKKDR